MNAIEAFRIVLCNAIITFAECPNAADKIAVAGPAFAIVTAAFAIVTTAFAIVTTAFAIVTAAFAIVRAAIATLQHPDCLCCKGYQFA
jgi:hypothetical protein